MQKYKSRVIGQGAGVRGQGARKIFLIFILFFFLSSFILHLSPIVFAQEKPKPNEALEPITITSNRMDANKKEHIVTFTGSVVAEQKEMTLHSDTLHVYYTEGDDVREIVAVGSVRLIQPNKIATGEKAVYYKAEGKVVLTGSPQAQHGNDVVKGDKITVFLNDNKSIVEGEGAGRVKAVIFPKKGESGAKEQR